MSSERKVTVNAAIMFVAQWLTKLALFGWALKGGYRALDPFVQRAFAARDASAVIGASVAIVFVVVLCFQLFSVVDALFVRDSAVKKTEHDA